MSGLIAKKGSDTEYVSPKPGLTVGIVSSIIDCGTTYDEKWKKDKHDVMITLALPKQTHIFEEGQAPEMLTISRWFTLSMHKKGNLKPFVEGITNMAIDDDFDLFKLLGANCSVHLVDHTNDNGDKRVVIASTSPMMDGSEYIAIETSKFSFGDFKQSEFDALSERMQDRLKKSKEYQDLITNNPLVD